MQSCITVSLKITEKTSCAHKREQKEQQQEQ